MITRIKEVVRTIAPGVPYLWKRIKRASLLLRSTEDIFTSYYRKNTWQDRDSVSGPGSNLESTRAVREQLPALLEHHGIESLLDLPCGDYYWMSKVELGIPYMGGDIVEALIEENRQRYGEEEVEFAQLNLVEDDLPQYDAILCRDCLVHLSYSDIKASLANIKASGATYLLTTTFPDRRRNENIPTGDWRPINLERPPFNFPIPLDLIDEECSEHGGVYRDKSLGIWRVADLPA